MKAILNILNSAILYCSRRKQQYCVGFLELKLWFARLTVGCRHSRTAEHFTICHHNFLCKKPFVMTQYFQVFYWVSGSELSEVIKILNVYLSRVRSMTFADLRVKVRAKAIRRIYLWCQNLKQYLKFTV